MRFAAFGNALATMVLLGLAIGILSRYYRSVSSEYTTLIIYATGLLVVVPLAFGLARVDGLVLHPPSGIGAVLGVAACGMMIAFADYFGVKAFNSGGSTIMVAAVIAAAPALSAMISFATGGDKPDLKSIVGFLLIFAGVTLVRGFHPPTEAPTQQSPHP